MMFDGNKSFFGHYGTLKINKNKPVTNSRKRIPNSTCEGCIYLPQHDRTQEFCSVRGEIKSDADANICSV